ncbi:hypothetical protein C8Q77DRAFT_608027 [Trametes polyzona]|nr:hypothetical protein C8Q77DRAFT_608027 [Trametes polyzona]
MIRRLHLIYNSLRLVHHMHMSMSSHRQSLSPSLSLFPKQLISPAPGSSSLPDRTRPNLHAPHQIRPRYTAYCFPSSQPGLPPRTSSKFTSRRPIIPPDDHHHNAHGADGKMEQMFSFSPNPPPAHHLHLSIMPAAWASTASSSLLLPPDPPLPHPAATPPPISRASLRQSVRRPNAALAASVSQPESKVCSGSVAHARVCDFVRVVSIPKPAGFSRVPRRGGNAQYLPYRMYVSIPRPGAAAAQVAAIANAGSASSPSGLGSGGSTATVPPRAARLPLLLRVLRRSHSSRHSTRLPVLSGVLVASE